MKFIVSSTYLLKQLQILGGVINNSNTLPILDNFLFDLKKDKLTVSASDLETTMSSIIKVDSDNEGTIAVPARLLLEMLKTFPEQPLTFVVEAGNDDLRPVMSGVFFQFSTENLTFVATDAHKLVKYQRTDVTATQVAEFIMPKKPLTLLKGILAGSESDVLIEYNDSNAKFSFEETELICRLIDGKYPNYEAVIPKENPNKLTIARNQFLSSVKRVSIFSNKTTHQIRLKIAGAELNISAEDIDYSNKAEERLTCSYQGDDMQIGFNSRFLTEMLNNLNSDEVSLEMSLPNRAGILMPSDGLDEGEYVTMLVMPVMLNN